MGRNDHLQAARSGGPPLFRGTLRRVAIAVEEETPTGIRLAELDDLARGEKQAIARWQLGKAGFDDGLPFYGRRIRDLPIATKLRLATDPELDLKWEARELARVRLDPVYFTTQYGSVQPEEGPPVPFDLWPEQAEALDQMVEHLRVIVLKARQLGLTWLALHLAIWMMAFNRLTPKAKILVLSKIGTDADELVERARRLTARLPAFLRPRESKRWRDSNSRFVLTTGSEMRSLMGTPAAARSFTASMVIFDEFAFYRNGQAGKTWTAAEPTLGERGKAIVISTGNGESGDGAAYADLWKDAVNKGLHPIFLPDTVNPARRVEGWREKKRLVFLTEADFLAEHPLTEEHAFSGSGSYKVYPQAGLAAALKLGERLDLLLPELVVDGVEWGIDWGDFQTFAVYGIPLPGGGMFIFDEVVMAHTEPEKAAEQIIYRDPAGIPDARFTFSGADSNPAGSNRTFARVLREAYNAQPDRFPSKHTTIEFGRYKQGGGERQRSGAKGKPNANTVAYLQHLLDAAQTFSGDASEVHGILAVSPRCQTLAAQMRNLEREADTGKVVKPNADPRHVERGDHGPDATIALMARKAKLWRAEVGA